MTPVDLVKCNAQTNPTLFPSVLAGARAIYSGKVSHLGFAPGLKGLTTGWAPTFWGYGVQGVCKFGLNEYFKYKYVETGLFSAPEHGVPSIPLSVAASASAELIADLGLCPLEAVKVRVQTSPDFARGLRDGLPKMLRQEGMGSLYAGLVPLWGRQVPYTVTKFLAFERIADAIYAKLPKKKSDMSQVEQMTVVFACQHHTDSSSSCGSSDTYQPQPLYHSSSLSETDSLLLPCLLLYDLQLAIWPAFCAV